MRRLVERSLRVLALAAALLLVDACQSAAERQAAQRARIEQEASAKIDRICALPKDQREAELKKLQQQTGVGLACPD